MNRDRLNRYLQSIAVMAVTAQHEESAEVVLVLLDEILGDAKAAVATAELIEEGKV